MYDAIIVGAGPAGLTAALYTGRKKMKTLIISSDLGGQVNLTEHIENYPGVNPQPGFQLIQKFEENAKSFGAEFFFGKVTKIEKKDKIFYITTNKKTYQSKTLILAFGRVSRKLGISGEEKFFGKGISTCAICDAPFFKDKTVAVIGGGNSALDAALELTKFTKKIYLIHRREEFRGDELVLDKVRQNKKIEPILNSIPLEIKGNDFIQAILIKNLKTKDQKEIPLNGIFLEIGYEVDNHLVKDLVKTNKKNEIIIDNKCQTSQPGIFAAGDVTDTPFKQVVIAAGEGAKAALQAHEYFLNH